MGIAKKGKRKIVVDEVDYYWYISDDPDGHATGTIYSLTVISDDKKFLVKYPINQNHGENHLIVLGKRFGGKGEWGNNWQRLICPKIEVGEKVLPSSVEKLIKWSISDKPTIFVNWQGAIIE